MFDDLSRGYGEEGGLRERIVDSFGKNATEEVRATLEREVSRLGLLESGE